MKDFTSEEPTKPATRAELDLDSETWAHSVLTATSERATKELPRSYAITEVLP